MTTLSFSVLWRDMGAQRGLENLSKGAAGAAGAIGKVAKVGALAFAGAAVAAGGYGLKVASANEQAEISFTTMLGSAKKAGSFLSDLQKFAASTPFEFPELQTAASSLISAGINADKVIPIMRTLGDVTSGMGTGSEGVKRATVALQQMSAAGRITGEDLNQLRDAGIPVYDLLAKATGKSKGEVVKLANAGKLGKKELGEMMKALESGKGLERFSGLMDKQSKSLSGMWSTVKDTVGQGLAQALQPALPLIKQGIGTLTTGLGGLSKWVSNNKGSLAEVFKVAGTTLKTFGDLTSAWLGPFVKSLTGGKNTFKDFADFLGTHQSEITDGLVAGARFAIEFASALGTMASVGLKAFAFLTDSQADLTALMLINFKGILHGAALAFGWVPGLGEKLKSADSKFDGFATGLVTGMHDAASGARKLADGIDTKMTPALAAARRGLDKAADQSKLQAASRDTANAVSLIGTKADGTQIHLKRFADRSKLSADAQAGLKSRISLAQTALRDQIGAMKAAGAGQEKLSDAWKTGKKRLYDEFIQMGLSKKEAGHLADKYAGIQPKVKTTISQPGMKDALADSKTLLARYNSFHDRDVNLGLNLSSNYKSVKKKFDLAFPQSRAKGGPVQNLSGKGRQSYDTEPAMLRVDEHVWTPEEVDAVGGHSAMYRMRQDARQGAFKGYKAGGAVLSTGFRSSGVPGIPDPKEWGARAGGYMASAAAARMQSRITKAFSSADGLGAGVTTGNPHGLVRVGGVGYWSRLFAANIHRAEHDAGRKFHVYQAGWNHGRVAASGSTHNGDAIDAQQNMALRNAFRRHVGAMWFRNWPGNYHMHGVPAPGRGYGSASARWQYQDYKRGGDGLHTGGVVMSPGRRMLAEKGPERVLSAPQTRAFEQLVPLLTRGGAGNVTLVLHASNYIGAQRDLADAFIPILTTLNRQGRLQVIKGN